MEYSCIYKGYVYNNLLMKKIVFYSNDFTLSISLLMYLQSNYNITTTSNIEDIKAICSSFNCDLIIIDAEPTKKVEEICKDIKSKNPSIHIILVYVYDNKFKELELNIKKYINTIFYKPFDLENVSKQLTALTS